MATIKKILASVKWPTDKDCSTIRKEFKQGYICDFISKCKALGIPSDAYKASNEGKDLDLYSSTRADLLGKIYESAQSFSSRQCVLEDSPAPEK